MEYGSDNYRSLNVAAVHEEWPMVYRLLTNLNCEVYARARYWSVTTVASDLLTTAVWCTRRENRATLTPQLPFTRNVFHSYKYVVCMLCLVCVPICLNPLYATDEQVRLKSAEKHRLA